MNIRAKGFNYAIITANYDYYIDVGWELRLSLTNTSSFIVNL